LAYPVPEGRDPVEGHLEVGLQGAAYGLELKADAVERGGRARQPAHARAVEARGEGGGAEAVEEGAAVRRRHGTKARRGSRGRRAGYLAASWSDASPAVSPCGSP